MQKKILAKPKLCLAFIDYGLFRNIEKTLNCILTYF